ncbi:hypothetical protein D9M69_636830 [compost metagenome]
MLAVPHVDDVLAVALLRHKALERFAAVVAIGLDGRLEARDVSGVDGADVEPLHEPEAGDRNHPEVGGLRVGIAHGGLHIARSQFDFSCCIHSVSTSRFGDLATQSMSALGSGPGA